MDKALLACRAADSLADIGRTAEQIGNILDVKTTSVYYMIKAWEVYTAYTPTLQEWSYTQIVSILPVADQIPDFFARMNIDRHQPPSVRKLKDLVKEYRATKKEFKQSFNLLQDDDFVKIDGEYLPLTPEDKEKIRDMLLC